MIREDRKRYLEKKYMGKTIRIIYLVPGSIDDNPRYAGKTGVVNYIDDEGNLFGTWGGISILVGEDEFEIIPDE